MEALGAPPLILLHMARQKCSVVRPIPTCTRVPLDVAHSSRGCTTRTETLPEAWQQPCRYRSAPSAESAASPPRDRPCSRAPKKSSSTSTRSPAPSEPTARPRMLSPMHSSRCCGVPSSRIGVLASKVNSSPRCREISRSRRATLALCFGSRQLEARTTVRRGPAARMSRATRSTSTGATGRSPRVASAAYVPPSPCPSLCLAMLMSLSTVSFTVGRKKPQPFACIRANCKFFSLKRSAALPSRAVTFSTPSTSR
mmetsp:Transcript_146398/g.407830  ORF Transcript_146398/g.407830 Transcript_146398/m.407830 type:complete len:255 (+) Transcript_146398:2580-3344(+)